MEKKLNIIVVLLVVVLVTSISKKIQCMDSGAENVERNPFIFCNILPLEGKDVDLKEDLFNNPSSQSTSSYHINKIIVPVFSSLIKETSCMIKEGFRYTLDNPIQTLLIGIASQVNTVRGDTKEYSDGTCTWSYITGVVGGTIAAATGWLAFDAYREAKRHEAQMPDRPTLTFTEEDWRIYESARDAHTARGHQLYCQLTAYMAVFGAVLVNLWNYAP